MKALRIFLLFLIIIGIALLLTQKFWVPKLVNQIISWEGIRAENEVPVKQAGKTSSLIFVTTQKIKEENFSGTIAVISGSSTVAIKAQTYIDHTISEFRKEANADVPSMREKFGADNPTANYEIDIDAKYIKDGKTESVVMSVYTYTGGAHGSSVYKVITADRTSGKILSLSNIIKPEEQNAFTEFVKKELNNWRLEGGGVSPVFPDQVKNLKFSSFANWSKEDDKNDKNLIIYFDQYVIGPGALGATAFPLPLNKIKNFLQ